MSLLSCDIIMLMYNLEFLSESMKTIANAKMRKLNQLKAKETHREKVKTLMQSVV